MQVWGAIRRCIFGVQVILGVQNERCRLGVKVWVQVWESRFGVQVLEVQI